MDVSRETLEKLKTYHGLLLKWQESINLIADSTIDSAWERHFLDSIQLLKHVPEDVTTVVDMGSGGGFPGMVLAIMREDLKFYLVDSDSKKCEFLKTVSRETGVKVNVVNDRLEKVGKNLKADMVTARALANLPKLMKHMEGFSAKYGLFLKGKAYEEEIGMAKKEYEFDYEAFPNAVSDEGVALLIQHKDPVY